MGDPALPPIFDGKALNEWWFINMISQKSGGSWWFTPPFLIIINHHQYIYIFICIRHQLHLPLKSTTWQLLVAQAPMKSKRRGRSAGPSLLESRHGRCWIPAIRIHWAHPDVKPRS